uniref:Calcium-translocating P-type ATPase, PMCA-type n=1 Tax=uncultured Chloroflexota bacterium TaxID=166587 RepID=H5SCW6_9CHLR|nr:calcium-translocating P-type ATPase, PMCA-type [uncultured Chloroflexota bacterium]
MEQKVYLEGEMRPWHALSPQEVMDHLKVQEGGLSSKDVEQRLRIYGPNELTETPRPGFLAMLWGQINSFVIWLLIGAAVISMLLGDYIEAVAILAIVILNAVLGVIQEQRAEQALAALRQLAAPEAHVLREGRRVTIPARELVPGDMIFLEAGNYVPADVRLLESVNLRIEEAALTGESHPVQKSAAAILDENIPLGDRKNTAFMGTLVVYGRGRGVVVATGMRTQLGLIASMLQRVEEEETPLQRRLDQLGRALSIGALVLVAIVLLINLLNFTEISELLVSPADYLSHFAPNISDAFLIAVSLAVAAVPEGLPAVVTITLALGMREMVKRHALIRRLASVETLGSATVICSDKTGTLTQNEMTVTRLWVDGQMFEVSGSGYNPEGAYFLNGRQVNLADYPAALTAIWLGILNNDAQLETTGANENRQTYRVVGDPTEGALLVAAIKAGIEIGEIQRVKMAYPRESEVPFDSERKRMITVHDVYEPHPGDISPFRDTSLRGWDVIAIKGAPEAILPMCTRYQRMNDESIEMSDEIREAILKANDTLTAQALRVLAIAFRVAPDVPDESPDVEEIERDLVFVGLIGMIDPPRPEVIPALEKAQRAGIRTLMITGDYPNTARAIAQSIGLLRAGNGRVVTGQDLEQMDDARLREEIRRVDVFARVNPSHKLRIVEALQANGEVVAMTGDGVNDAPAIKRADIGIAMGISGTDVAKQTADMVLMDDNYASIVAAVEQGRVIYSNIRKFVFYLLSANLAEILIIFLSTLAGLPSPLTAIQLLWLNLVTDGAPALALAMEKGDPDVMEHPPRPKNEPIINRPLGIGLIVQSIVQTAVVLVAFGLGLLWHLRSGDILPPGANPIRFLLEYDWRGLDVQTAETMAFVTLSLVELFRAYTVRSERASLFQIGVRSNVWMQRAVGLSLLLLLLVCIVPFLQPIFNTHFLAPREWAVVLGLAVIPAIAEEITKFFLRRMG